MTRFKHRLAATVGALGMLLGISILVAPAAAASPYACSTNQTAVRYQSYCEFGRGQHRAVGQCFNRYRFETRYGPWVGARQTSNLFYVTVAFGGGYQTRN